MIAFKQGDIEALRAFYSVYCDVFPKNERKSFEKLVELITCENYQFLLAYDMQCDVQKPVGYVCLLNGVYVWLDYLFVDPLFQDKGYGSQIIKALLEMLKPSHRGMFLEVEKISSEDINTRRRVNFYERLGAFAITVDYQLPTETSGLPMDLFYFPFCVSMPSTTECLRVIKTAFDTIHDDLVTRQNIYEWIVARNKNRICSQQRNANRF